MRSGGARQAGESADDVGIRTLTAATAAAGPACHDWAARMRTITEMRPDITKWFRDVRNCAVNQAGYADTRR